jgi:hypothetical protein
MESDRGPFQLHLIAGQGQVHTATPDFQWAARDSKPSPEVRRPLRYAVILESENIAAWQERVLDNLAASGDSKLVAFILPERAEEPSRFSLREFFSNFVYYLARMTFWKPKQFRQRPMPKRWAVLGRIRVHVQRKGKFSDYIADEDIERLKALNLDFILKFGLRILRGKALNAARYGVWSFHHGDERQVRGRPAGFWEIYHGMPTTGVILQRLTERLDGGVVLKRGVLGTIPHSYLGSLARMYRQGEDFPALVCSDILRGAAGYLQDPPSSTKAPIFKNPSNWQTLVCLARITWSSITRFSYGAFKLKVWGIGLIKGPMESVMDPKAGIPVTWLTSRAKNVFVADPFLVAGTKGRTWLFYEHLNYGTMKGRIGCVEVGSGPIDMDGPAVLADNHHFSFPCVFQHEGAIYCVPEEAENDRVRLFKFDEDKRILEEVGTLLSNIKAIDPAVFFHEGLWWIAATDATKGEVRLVLWHSSTLLGPYVPHAGNPVKIDSRNTRAAGRPFEWKGKKYRPAQDTSQGYGKKVHLQEIVRLDPKGYEEQHASTILPFDPVFSKGLHQISSAGEWTVVDGYREIIHPLAWYFRLKSYFRTAGAAGG